MAVCAIPSPSINVYGTGSISKAFRFVEEQRAGNNHTPQSQELGCLCMLSVNYTMLCKVANDNVQCSLSLATLLIIPVDIIISYFVSYP